MSNIRSGAKLLAKRLAMIAIRFALAQPSTCKQLNKYYNRMGWASKAKWHGRYAKMYLGKGLPLSAGVWSVSFLNYTILLPFRSEHSWVDWDNATSILGAEIDVKKCYARFISSRDRPDVFVDVGASYGTHSLLFAAAGIRTIAFEPNPSCAGYAKIAADLNALQIEWHQTAIGERDDEIELVFPERNTWVGAVSESAAGHLLRKERGVRVEHVLIQKLDRIAKELFGKRVLIKIDVESSEVAVLRGASTVLQQVRPIIVFESFAIESQDSRSDLFDVLTAYGYVVMRIFEQRPALNKEEFCGSFDNNFISRPLEQIERKESKRMQ